MLDLKIDVAQVSAELQRLTRHLAPDSLQKHNKKLGLELVKALKENIDKHRSFDGHPYPLLKGYARGKNVPKYQKTPLLYFKRKISASATSMYAIAQIKNKRASGMQSFHQKGGYFVSKRRGRTNTLFVPQRDFFGLGVTTMPAVQKHIENLRDVLGKKNG